MQWMTAGRGIIHRELAYRNEHAHTLQLWVNMPAAAKLTGSGYQDIRAAGRPVSAAGGVRVDPVSVTSSAGVSGALLTLEPGTALDHALPATHRAFGYVLSGRALISGRAVAGGQVAWSDPAGRPGRRARSRSVPRRIRTRSPRSCCTAGRRSVSRWCWAARS